MDAAAAVEVYAHRLGRFRARLRHHILAYLEVATTSPTPSYYVNQLGYAALITWLMITSTKQTGTPQDYATVADQLVVLWCKPITIEGLMEIATVLQEDHEQRLAHRSANKPKPAQDKRADSSQNKSTPTDMEG